MLDVGFLQVQPFIRARSTNMELRKQAKDKAVAIENEKLWRDRVNRITPKCDELGPVCITAI